MEPFRVTTVRIAGQVWQQMEDKSAILRSLGFEGSEEQVAKEWITLIDAALGDRDEAVMRYLMELIQKGALRDHSPEELLDGASHFADCDAFLLFMMIGKERGRLEYESAAQA